MAWEYFSVKAIVEKIDNGECVLPVIQRDFVWGTEKIELLFDTLLKGQNFGGIMAILEEKGHKPLFAYRKFSKDGSTSNSAQPFDELERDHYFIIDGQQRLQSFYIGLKNNYRGKDLYFNILSREDFYDFRFSENKETLPEKEKDEDGKEIRCKWYSVPELYKGLYNYGYDDRKFTKNWDYISELSTDEREIVGDNIDAFVKNIITAPNVGLCYFIPNRSNINKDIQTRLDIVELFRRLNDGATKLSNLDLMMSTFKGYDFRMEKILHDCEENSEFRTIHLGVSDFIQFILMLRDKPKAKLYELELEDTNFVINNEKRIIDCLKSVIEFLRTTSLIDFYNSDNRSIKPILFIAYYLFHKDSLENDKIKDYFKAFECNDTLQIKKWFILSYLNGVFSRGCGWQADSTGVKKTIELLGKHKEGNFPVGELFLMYKNYPLKHWSEEIRLDALDLYNREFLYYLIYTTSKSSARSLNDVDHIMPKSILENMKFQSEDIWSVKNYQLIYYVINRGSKNSTPFKEWVTNKENVPDLNSYLKLHLIPEDESLWTEDKFIEFSKARGNLIVERIKSWISEYAIK